VRGAATSYGRGRAVPGTRLNGIFEIERLIATGGMGEIYKGRAIETGDTVAIKMIRADLADNEAALAVLRKEASALHNLNHEAIVRYYVFSIDPILGCPYLAMQFVEGRSLSEVLQRGPLSFDQVLILQRRLAAGLQAAHELRIIHREVSPDNIKLPGDNVVRAKIIDFGIARSIGDNDGTIIGNGFAGNSNYVSPEQLGMFGGNIGPKSDIYSLGLVLAQALIGHPLDMGGTQAQVLEKRRTVPDLSEIDPRIRPLFKQMLQPNPADRPQSMAEVAAWRVGGPGEVAAPRTGSRLKIGVSIAGIAALAAAGVAAFIFEPGLWQLVSGQSSGRVYPEELPALASDPPQAMEAPTLMLPDAPPELSSRAEPPPTLAERQPEPPRLSPGLPDAAPGPSPAAPSAGPVAGLPNAPLIPPSALPPSRPAGAEEVRRYLTSYQGGDCFFVTPLNVSVNVATVEAYGASPAPFEAFDEAFRQANGFEALIGLRKVNPVQCPAVSFLARIAQQRADAPRLEINSFSLRSGQFLSGSVEAVGDRHIDLLLVADDGAVHNLAGFTRKSGNSITFNVKIDTSATGGAAKPQILLAVSSGRPLALLSSRTPMVAEKIFPQIIDEAVRTGQTLGASVKYIEIEG